MDLSHPAYEFKNQRGRPDGVSVGLAAALAKNLRRPLLLVPCDFAELIASLQARRIDLILSSMTISDPRKLAVDFSDPYVITGRSLLIPVKSPVRNLDDLKIPGGRIFVTEGNGHASWLREKILQATVQVLKNAEACALEVAAGRADVFLSDQLTICRSGMANADTTRAILSPLDEESWGIGIRKGDEDLRLKVNDFLRTFRENGGLGRLADRYLPAEKKMFEATGQPFLLR